MILSIIFFVLAYICNAIMDTLQFRHDRSVFKNLPDYHFFGALNWTRKYKREHLDAGGFKFSDPPKSGLYAKYHRFFGLKYKEKFLFSGTALIFLVDGWHFFQFLMYLFFALSVLIPFGFSPATLIMWVVVFRVLGSVVFELFYSQILKS